MTSELLRAVEFAAVRGWPALDARDIHGWVWRFTSGGSIRANSVAALTYRGGDVNAAIDSCEALYRGKGATAVFTISDASEPADLDARLDARGYERGEGHITMAKTVMGLSTGPASAPNTASAQPLPSEAWMAAYLTGLSEDRRGVARQLIANLPPMARFISVSPHHASDRATDRPVTSCGLTIPDGDIASVQCMATVPEARRHGGAGEVLKMIEALAVQRGTRHLYLQTSGTNTAAQALYTRHGYSVIGRYHTRSKQV